MKLDRRNFMGVSAAMLAASGARAAGVDADPIKDMIVINALGGLGDPNQPADSLVPQFSPRVLAEAHASGLTAVNITLGYVSGSDDPFEQSVREVAETDAQVRANSRDPVSYTHLTLPTNREV